MKSYIHCYGDTVYCNFFKCDKFSTCSKSVKTKQIQAANKLSLNICILSKKPACYPNGTALDGYKEYKRR